MSRVLKLILTLNLLALAALAFLYPHLMVGPGKLIPGMGGAMDLVTGARKVIVATEHCDKFCNSKILKECTLPLTAKGKVSLIVTDMAVMEVTPQGLLLKEIAEGLTVGEVVKATDAELIIPKKVGTL